MIGYLQGTVIKKTSQFILLKTNGIGYRVQLLPSLLSKTSTQDKLKLFIHQYVREDELSLYGFTSFKELETFELVTSISGIGPKLGFSILSTVNRKDLQQAVTQTDLSILTRIPGIGKKSASKILLELSNKLDVEQDMSKMIFSKEDESAIEALQNLGFKAKEAKKAIHKAGKDHDKLENKIRAGLKWLNA